MAAGKFRLSSKNLFLTWPQANHAEHTLPELQLFLLDKCPNLQYLTACREEHDEEGQHFHALITFKRKFETQNTRFFDWKGAHPHIQSNVRSIGDTVTYIKKDGQFISDHPLVIAKPTYADILKDSGSAAEAMAKIQLWHPRDFLLYRERFVSSLASIYKPPDINYEHPPNVIFHDNLPGLLSWMDLEVCSLQTLSTITFIFEHTVH